MIRKILANCTTNYEEHKMTKLFSAIPHEPKEVGVNASVVGEFGVEGGSHRPTLSNEYGVTTLAGEDFNSGPDLFDFGCSDKDHF